jgi:hypothetical protein
MDARSPFACLLLGQPTLRRRVKLGTLAALDQRIALLDHLHGMDLGETVSYIKHHLQLAGRTDTMFNDQAIALLHQTSRGIPRAVNNLALQALIAAFADGKGIVDEPAAPRRRHRSHRRLTTPHSNPVPTATIPAVGTTTSRHDHHHAHAIPPKAPDERHQQQRRSHHQRSRRATQAKLQELAVLTAEQDQAGAVDLLDTLPTAAGGVPELPEPALRRLFAAF